MEGPLLSFCGTVYNSARTVKNSLDSILKQFNGLKGGFEVVVVDNFSTDGTWEILKSYSKKYKNFKIIQAKCSRGLGRAIAYNHSTGKYFMSIDLDNIYEPILREVIEGLIKTYKPYSLINPIHFMDRRTMDRIGNWRDLLAAEDMELYARALSKGIKIYSLPVHLFQNEIARGNREERYSGFKFRRLKRLIRLYKATDAALKAQGALHFKDVIRKTRSYEFLAKIVLLKIKILRQKVYRYSDRYINSIYMADNTRIIDPRKLHIPKKYIILTVGIWLQNLEAFNKLQDDVSKFHFDHFKLIGKRYRTLIISTFYYDETAKDILKFNEKFYQSYYK
ncbi:MAG: glycosyltransferase [Candidatus Acidifodinimicrobium sp.]